MRRAWAPLGLLGALACNGLVNFGELQFGADDPGAASDAAVVEEDQLAPPLRGDARATFPRCDLTKPFGAPTLVPGPLNQATSFEHAVTLTDDELTIVFDRFVGPDTSVLMATRAAVDEAFGEPYVIPSMGSTRRSAGPTMTGDGLSLYYTEQEREGDLILTSKALVVTRATRIEPFGPPQDYRPTPEDAIHLAPAIARDGTELYFSMKTGNGTTHYFRSVRGVANVFQAPLAVQELLGPDGNEIGMAITKDGLTVFLGSSRSGGLGNYDVYTARRPERTAPFGTASLVTELSSTAADRPGWISTDGCRLYLGSKRDGAGGLYVATRPP